jgi:hypothetical protein
MGAPNEPIGLREAISIAVETGESLGGRTRQAMELLVSIANRDRAEEPPRPPVRKRPSSGSMEAAQHVASSGQHFAAVREELKAGQRDVKRITDRMLAVEQQLDAAETEMIEASHALLDGALAQEELKK